MADSVLGGHVTVRDSGAKNVGGLRARIVGGGGEVAAFDTAGKVAAALFVGRKQSGVLQMSDRNDSVYALIGPRSDTAGFRFTLKDEESGHDVLTLFGSHDGGNVALRTRAGAEVALLGSNEYGPTLALWTAEAQRPLGRFWANSNGGNIELAGGDMQVMNGDGKRMAALFASPTGTGRLQLYDGAGTLKHAVP